MKDWSASRIVLVAAAVVFAVAPLAFSLVALASGMSLSETYEALIGQYRTRRLNLIVCSTVALFPVLLLALTLWIGRRFGKFEKTGAALAWGGVLPILAVTIAVNLEFWPIFLPARVYPGFPHGLEFLLGPAFAAPAAMLVGMLMARMLVRVP